MRILVATTGVLRPGPVVDLCRRLADPIPELTVMTVIQVPHTFLSTMDETERRSLLDDTSWESETAEMKALNYLEERGRRVVEPVVSALTAAGMDPTVRFVEGDDAAESILETARSEDADLIVMGATRRLFPDESWRSVSSRVTERADCPVVLVPGPRSDDTVELPRAQT